MSDYHDFMKKINRDIEQIKKLNEELRAYLSRSKASECPDTVNELIRMNENNGIK